METEYKVGDIVRTKCTTLLHYNEIGKILYIDEGYSIAEIQLENGDRCITNIRNIVKVKMWKQSV